MRGKSAQGKDVWSLKARAVNDADDNGWMKSQDHCGFNWVSINKPGAV